MVGIGIVRVGAPVPEPALVLLAPEGCIDLLVGCGHLVHLAHRVALASVRPALDHAKLARLVVAIDLQEYGVALVRLEHGQYRFRRVPVAGKPPLSWVEVFFAGNLDDLRAASDPRVAGIHC